MSKINTENLLSGKGSAIGFGTIVPVPITLDPALYEGMLIYASDQNCYFSNGTEWKSPADVSRIARPRALFPVTQLQQTQLRITDYYSFYNEEPASALYQVSITGDFENDILFSRQLEGEVLNIYQTIWPEDGLAPDQSFYWRASYIGQQGSQSEFSIPYLQVYPPIINKPIAVTKEGAITIIVQVTPFFSLPVFNQFQFEIQTEFYTQDGLTLIVGVSQPSGGSTVAPDIPQLQEGQNYLFRTRYVSRSGPGAPLQYSEWCDFRRFFLGGRSMLLEYDITLAPNRTVSLPFGLSDNGQVNVSVDWGDGIIENFTTNGVKTHVYALGVSDVVSIVIKGILRQFGGNVNQQGLRSVSNWGLGLGLVSLRGALRNTGVALQYVSPVIPSTVTVMADMFLSSQFNQPIGDWDVSNVTNMQSMFYTSQFNQPIGDWDVSNVTNMQYMFYASQFNQPIGDWDVSNVTNMQSMFYASPFNQPIGDWDVSNVTNMQQMFQSSPFNQPIGDWDVSNVTNMQQMFYTSKFNQPIGDWDVSNVTNMQYMFQSSQFNQPIGDWDVSNVTNMQYMFYASPFNQPIGDWDVSNVTNMQYMFLSSPFNQPIGDWELNNIAVNMTSFGTLLSSINYSKTLVGWANNIDRRNGPFGTIINLSATRRYDNTDYSLEYPGGRFANAVEARAYLIGTRSISVTGSTDSLANGVYNYVSETKTYDNPVSGFYFFKALTVWQLRDNANIVLDSSPGDSAEPYLAPQYTTVLATAVIRRLGAQWTITGDALL